jgi:hypothetical protein
MSEISVSVSDDRKLSKLRSTIDSVHLVRLSDLDFTQMVLYSEGLYFFLENQVHSFRDQDLGLDAGHAVTAYFLLADQSRLRTQAVFYKRAVGEHEPCLKIENLETSFQSGDLLAFIWSDARKALGLINLTSATELTIENVVSDFQSGWSLGDEEPDSGDSEMGNSATPRDAADSNSDGNLSGSSDMLESISLLREIWARSAGGSLAAVSPRSRTLQSKYLGSWGPGLIEAQRLFLEQISQGKQVSLFLVGGPGAGKSTFAQHLLAGAQLDLKEQEISNLRSFDVETDRGEVLRFVNDASIREDLEASALSDDVEWASRNGASLLVCANRGVIADDLNLATQGDDSAYVELFSWLSQRVDSLSENSTNDLYVVQTDFLQVRFFDDKGQKRLAIAVFLDVLSLLEPEPELTSSDGMAANFAEIVPSSVSHSGNFARGRSPMGMLLQTIVADLDPEAIGRDLGLTASSPLVENIRLLRSSSFQQNLLAALRIWEINFEAKVTYRLFWATLAKLIFGPLLTISVFEDIASALRSLDSFENEENFDALLESVSYYAPFSLFSSYSRDNSGFSDLDDRVTEMWKLVDPALRSSADSARLPALFGDESLIDVVNDVLKSVEPDSPASVLFEIRGLGSLNTSRFSHHLANVHKLAFQDKQTKDALKRKQQLFYAQTLVRAAAFMSGEFFGAEEAEVWTTLLAGVPMITTDESLKGKFEALLKPRTNEGEANSPSLMPLFDSELRPIRTSDSDAPRLAITLDNVQLRTRKRGPFIYLVLEEFGQLLGEIRINYSLIREALASSTSAQGVTDQSIFVDPRLDRVRASKLSGASGANNLDLVLIRGNTLTGVRVNVNG